MTARSSAWQPSGAAEHTPFHVCFAVSNVGLPGAAVRGQKWKRHHKKLLKLFVQLLNGKDLLGLLLVEVGCWTDFLTTE